MDTPPYCIQLMYSGHFTTLYRRIVMYSGHTTILYTSNVYWTLSRLFAFGTQSHYVHWEQSLTPVYRMPGQIMLIFQKKKEIFIIFFLHSWNCPKPFLKIINCCFSTLLVIYTLICTFIIITWKNTFFI